MNDQRPNLHSLAHLLDFLKKSKQRLFLQAHNFPDHDAVASAYAFRNFLSQFGIHSELIYEGEIQRQSLANMIEALNIPIRKSSNWNLKVEDQIIVLDGCKGNKNVTDLIGDEIGVIDHHEVTSPEDVPYVDIRSHYGSTCTIIHTYFTQYNLVIPQAVASAMLIGLNMDTALMTRGVSPFDIEAYADLYSKADIPAVNSLLRNQVQTRDLDFFRKAMDQIEIEKAVAFCYFEDGCNQNLLGMLGDFFLSLQEVDFVILCARNAEKINFSLRSECDEWNASLIIQQVLEGIGFGGGHKELAGGMIPDLSKFNSTRIKNQFLEILLSP